MRRFRKDDGQAQFQFLVQEYVTKGLVFYQFRSLIQQSYNKKLEERKSSQMNICFDIHHETETKPHKEIQNESSCNIQSISTQNAPASKKKVIGSKKKTTKQSQYNWNETENRRYIKFLIKQGHLLLLPTEEKKRIRVNVQMSKAIQSKSSTQCHTHHQKMIQKHGSIEGIIAEFSHLIKSNKKAEKSITAPPNIQEAQPHFNEEPMEDNFARTSFFREYMCPIFRETQNQEEFLDFIWQL